MSGWRSPARMGAASLENDRAAIPTWIWYERMAADPAAAWAFCQAEFGWVETGTMDMVPAGTYRMDGASVANGSLGGIARRMPGRPANAWLFYDNVPDAGATLTAVGAAGGKAGRGPQPVPDAGSMGIAVDPQGAVFAVHSHAGRA